MTHDELPYVAIVKDLNKLIRKQMKAIDAVMALHTGEGINNRCVSCLHGNPCETIQVIKKELS